MPETAESCRLCFALVLTSLVCLVWPFNGVARPEPGVMALFIATLVMWFVLTITFIVTEWLQGPRAMVPLSLLKSRMTWTNAWIYLQ